MIIVIIVLIVHFAQFVHNSCKQTQVVLQHSLKALWGMMRWFFIIFDFRFFVCAFSISNSISISFNCYCFIAFVLLFICLSARVGRHNRQQEGGKSNDAEGGKVEDDPEQLLARNYLSRICFVCALPLEYCSVICSLYMVIYLVLYVFFHNNKHVDFFDLIFPVSFVYFCVFVWFTILKIYGLMGWRASGSRYLFFLFFFLLFLALYLCLRVERQKGADRDSKLYKTLHHKLLYLWLF